MHFSDIVRLTYKKKSGKINAIEFIPGVYITQNAALGKKHWEQGRANEPDMRNQTEVEYRNTRGKEYTGNTGEQEKWRENKQRQEVEG